MIRDELPQVDRLPTDHGFDIPRYPASESQPRGRVDPEHHDDEREGRSPRPHPAGEREERRVGVGDPTAQYLGEDIGHLAVGQGFRTGEVVGATRVAWFGERERGRRPDIARVDETRLARARWDEDLVVFDDIAPVVLDEVCIKNDARRNVCRTPEDSIRRSIRRWGKSGFFSAPRTER